MTFVAIAAVIVSVALAANPTEAKNLGKDILYHEGYAIQHFVYAVLYGNVESPKTGNTVVIYPTFTMAAYQEQGFYNHYRGTCTVIDCLTVNIPSAPPPERLMRQVTAQK